MRSRAGKPRRSKYVTGRGAAGGIPTTEGFKAKPVRGIYEIREACNAFFKSRGIAEGKEYLEQQAAKRLAKKSNTQKG